MTKIKICGLFRNEDIAYVNESLPDYVGFVFAESKRQITDEQAAQLSAQLDRRIIPVGVFVSERIERIVTLFNQGIIRMAQLHGAASASYIAELKSTCDIPIIKAIPINVSEADGELALSSPSAPAEGYLLFDYLHPGSGKTFDWALLQNVKQPYFLAGGINRDNIESALSYHPYCIDVSSGAETNGIKDREKIHTLVQRAHTYQQRKED